MRTFELSTPIRYPVQRVWTTLVDIDQWHRWNSVVPAAAGIVEPGMRLRLQLKDPKGRLQPFSPVVTTVRPPDELALAAVVIHRLLLSMHHRFLLNPIGPEETLLTQRWECTGALVPLLWRRITGGMHPFAAFGTDLERAIAASG